MLFFFFSSRRRHTRFDCDWSSDVCSSDLQLIEAASGHHLWADRYDRELADVFAVQDEIARSITGAIAPGIIAAEIRQAQRKDPDQLDAWDRTVRAHWHVRRFTREDLTEARRLLTQVLALYPANSMG